MYFIEVFVQMVRKVHSVLMLFSCVEMISLCPL